MATATKTTTTAETTTADSVSVIIYKKVMHKVDGKNVYLKPSEKPQTLSAVLAQEGIAKGWAVKPDTEEQTTSTDA